MQGFGVRAGADAMRSKPSTEVVPREPSLVLGSGERPFPNRQGREKALFCGEARPAVRKETEREEGRMAIVEDVAALREQTLAAIAQAGDTAALDQVRVAVLGKSGDRKSTRLNSSHVSISYAVFCLKKKTY